MFRFTSIFTRRSAFTKVATGLTAVALLGGAAAGPAAAVTTEYSGPVRGITTPAQAATEQYTGTLAEDILIGNAALGNPAPAPTSQYVNLSDQEVKNLKAAHAAKAYTLSGIIAERVSSSSVQPDVMYAKTNYQNGMVVANNTNRWLAHKSSVTGGTYILAPQAGYLEWIPKGGIGSLWKAKGGASTFGLPTGPERSVYDGVHAGAKKVIVQDYISSTGKKTTFQWTSAKGTQYVTGAIKTFYDANGGLRHHGIVTKSEYSWNGYVRMDTERGGSIIWSTKTGAKYLGK